MSARCCNPVMPSRRLPIGTALSIAGAVGPLVIDATRKRRKDFSRDLAADPEGEEKLASSLAELVTPALRARAVGGPPGPALSNGTQTPRWSLAAHRPAKLERT
jgi:hypothetical protein